MNMKPKLGDILRIKTIDHFHTGNRTIDEIIEVERVHLIIFGRFVASYNGYWIIEMQYDDINETSGKLYSVMANCIVDVKKLGVDKDDLPPRKGGT